jgi:hypothetical protein
MRIGAMKDSKLKWRNLHASHTLGFDCFLSKKKFLFFFKTKRSGGNVGKEQKLEDR